MPSQSSKSGKFLFVYGLLGLAIFIYLLCLLGMMIFLPKSPNYSMGDFDAYYRAGQAILADPASLYSREPVSAGYVNLPIIAYLFVPFALLSQRVAEVIFFLFSIASVIWFVLWSSKLFQLFGWRRNALIAAVLTSYPLFSSLRVGNTTHFILLLLLGCFVCIQETKQIRAGILLAIAGLIKIPLLFIFLFFLLKRQWKAMWAFLITIITTVIASLAVCGTDLNVTWVRRCIIDFSGKSIANYNVQSIPGFFLRLVQPIPFSLDLSWSPVGLQWEAKLLSHLIIAFLIGFTFWVFYRSKTSPGRHKKNNLEMEMLDFSILLTLSITITPISWTHYYLLLLLPITLYISGKLSTVIKGRFYNSFMLISIALIQFPVVTRYLFKGSTFAIFISNLFISHFLIGALTLFLILLTARQRRFVTGASQSCENSQNAS